MTPRPEASPLVLDDEWPTSSGTATEARRVSCGWPGEFISKKPSGQRAKSRSSTRLRVFKLPADARVNSTDSVGCYEGQSDAQTENRQGSEGLRPSSKRCGEFGLGDGLECKMCALGPFGPGLEAFVDT